MLKKLIEKMVLQKDTCGLHQSNLNELRSIVESLPSWEQRWAGNGDRLVEIESGFTVDM